jgi:cytochrome c-type biogenesis protein CcmH/NrfG
LQVLGQDQKNANAAWQLGLVLGFEGEFEESMKLLGLVVKANPDHISARYDLAMTQMMMGEMDEACANFKEVLRQNPAHEDANRQVIYCPD